MSLQLWIANKNYSSWSLRPWFLLKALNIPFDEQLATFVPGGSSYEKFLRFSPSGLVPCLGALCRGRNAFRVYHAAP